MMLRCVRRIQCGERPGLATGPWVWLALIVGFSVVAFGGETAAKEVGGRGEQPIISVTGPKALAEKVAYTERTAGTALREVEQALGLRSAGEIRVEWVKDTAGVRQVIARYRAEGGEGNADERWVAGVALYPERVVVLRSSSISPGNWPEIDALLKHELAHIVLGEVRHPRSHPQPVWLHEGLAQWVAGQLVFDSPFQLKLAKSTGALHSFARIERGFPADRGGASLAYQQSESMVRFIVARFGADTLRDILRAMAGGRDFYSAFELAAGVGFYEFEEEWLAYVGRMSALAWALGQGQLLLFLGSLTVALGWWVRRRRARKILDAWDREEFGGLEEGRGEMSDQPR